MARGTSPLLCKLLIFAVLPLGGTADSLAQSGHHIKVVLETKQSGASNQGAIQGSGGGVIRRSTVEPSGRIVANERQTTVQRSSGIFTLVLDGSESILSVTTRVPQSQIAYYHNYAAGIGYIERRIVFSDVGTSLRVRATTLADGQIQLRLVPRISYFSVERPGAIDFTEAATELVVPNGRPVSLAGSTANLHEITRQILGYRSRTSSDDVGLVVTATIQ